MDCVGQKFGCRVSSHRGTEGPPPSLRPGSGRRVAAIFGGGTVEGPANERPGSGWPLKRAVEVVGTVATKGSYNPGLASCLPWLVLSVWHIVEVTSSDLASGTDWLWAVVNLLVWVIVALPVGTFAVLSDRDSRYPFAPEELSRFEKYTQLIRTTIHP